MTNQYQGIKCNLGPKIYQMILDRPNEIIK